MATHTVSSHVPKSLKYWLTFVKYQDECHNVNTALWRAAVAGDAAEVEKFLSGSAGARFSIIPDNEAILTGN